MVGWQPAQPAAAATPQRVLLAYDSQNVQAEKAGTVATMQQMLTSAGVAVHVTAIRDYKPGMLKDYQGVVTLINWADGALTNSAFTADRAAFKGAQLHVGPGLTAQEANRLGATVTPFYRRQFVVTTSTGPQLLPYSERLDALTTTQSGGKTFGKLTIQGGDNRQYPYGYVRNQAGYVPTFTGEGISFITTMQAVAALFTHNQAATGPLLTITGVTPYTDQRLLRKLGNYLDARSIPYVVSARSVAANTDLSAFATYAETLSMLTRGAGVVMLDMPELGSEATRAGQDLHDNLLATLTELGKKKVVPIGFSGPSDWNLDRTLRTRGLAASNVFLQLPPRAQSPTLHRDDNAGTFALAYTSVSGASLASAKYGRALSDDDQRFALPTAVTFPMATSAKTLRGLEQRISAFQYDWRNPRGINTEIRIGTLSMGKRNGVIYLNGVQVTGGYHPEKAMRKPRKVVSRVNRFFKMQSVLLWGFFAVSLTTMAVLLLLGRRVYRNMYKRR